MASLLAMALVCGVSTAAHADDQTSDGVDETDVDTTSSYALESAYSAPTWFAPEHVSPTIVSPDATYPPPTDTMPDSNWAGCGLFDGQSKLVKAYKRKYVSGGGGLAGTHSDLNCGTDDGNGHGYGYLHIKVVHEDQWETKAAPLGRNWRDVASYFIAWGLYDPEVIRWNSAKQTWCFSRKMYLYQKDSNGTRHLVSTSYAKIGLGTTGVRIITAFPSRNQCAASSGVLVYQK